jgi:hypothetical protein
LRGFDDLPVASKALNQFRFFSDLSVAPDDADVGRLRALQQVDPYVVWALLTSAFKDQSLADPEAGFLDNRFAVLIEVDDPAPARRELLPSYYLPGAAAALAVLPVLMSSAEFERALFGPAFKGFTIRRLELCRARSRDANAEQAARHDQQTMLHGQQALLKKGAQDALEIRHPPSVCVIDDGCNFAAMALRGDGRGRIASIWHQGNDREVVARLKEGQFGSAIRPKAVLRPVPIGSDGQFGLVPTIDVVGSVNGLLLENPVVPPDAIRAGEQIDSDLAHYARRRYPQPVHRWSHGSAVLGLIAVDRLWFRGAHDRKGYVASRATPDGIAFVQLPDDTVVDTSGGSLAAHALDGIRHALARALPGQHVIVNLSFGTHSGGHDGTSLWDHGLKELLDTYDGSARAEKKTLHVVLPAGNSHGWRCHASKRLGPGATDLDLPWKVQPDNPHESFLEVWLPPGATYNILVSTPAGTTLEADAAAPVGAPAQGTRIVLPQPNGKQPPSHALIWPDAVPQSRIGTMALVAVGPTARWADLTRQGNSLTGTSFREGLRAAPHGVWSVTVRWTGGTEGEAVHAWVQRADTAPGRPVRAGHAYPGRQSYLVDRSTGRAPTQGDVDPAFTLNGLATLKHPRLYVIGAMRRSDLGVSSYTAAGPNRITPTRFEGPDWLVVGDESLDVPGLLTHTTFAGSRMRLSGTSLAAAAFTRLLYEHLLDPAKMPLTPMPYCGGPHDRRWAEGDPQQAPGYHRGDARRLLPDHPYGILRR